MIDTVLFDLDGTLLPMDQDRFVDTYMNLLAQKLAPHGYEPNHLVTAVWAGTRAMVENNGRTTNEEVFWSDFCHIFGEGARKPPPRPWRAARAVWVTLRLLPSIWTWPRHPSPSAAWCSILSTSTAMPWRRI